MVHSGPDRLGAQERHTNAEPSAAWTPGPWWVHGGNDGYGVDDTARLHIRQGDDGADYCLAVIISDIEELDACADANARLIAAAPDLYEALKDAAACFREYERLHNEKGTSEGAHKARANASMADRCEAALSKAEGR